MKIDLFDGLSPMTQDRKSVEYAVEALDRAKKALEKELARRTENDKFVYGIKTVNGYTNYGPSFSEAVKSVTKQYNDADMAYRLEKVYL